MALSPLVAIFLQGGKRTNFKKVFFFEYFSSSMETCKPSDLLNQKRETSQLYSSCSQGSGRVGLVKAGVLKLG